MNKPLVQKIVSGVNKKLGDGLVDTFGDLGEKLITYFHPEKMKTYNYTPFYDGSSFDPIKDHFNKSQLECRKFLSLMTEMAKDELIRGKFIPLFKPTSLGYKQGFGQGQSDRLVFLYWAPSIFYVDNQGGVSQISTIQNSPI